MEKLNELTNDLNQRFNECILFYNQYDEDGYSHYLKVGGREMIGDTYNLFGIHLHQGLLNIMKKQKNQSVLFMIKTYATFENLELCFNGKGKQVLNNIKHDEFNNIINYAMNQFQKALKKNIDNFELDRESKNYFYSCAIALLLTSMILFEYIHSNNLDIHILPFIFGKNINPVYQEPAQSGFIASKKSIFSYYFWNV